MMRCIPFLVCIPIYCADKELPRPIVIPKTVIIYPPTTAAEFLERRRILTNALTSPTLVRIMVKDKKPQPPAE